MPRGLSGLDLGILFAIAIVGTIFVVVAYGGRSRLRATGKPWLARQRRRGTSRMDHGYDPVMIEHVENGDVEHKFNVVNYLEAATERRLRKLDAAHGKDLAQMDKLEREIKDLEFGLQRTRRDLAAGGADKDALRRLIDTRGGELFGSAWNTSVNGAPTLSHVLAPADDEAEWRIGSEHFVAQHARAANVHPVPRLPLNKLS